MAESENQRRDQRIVSHIRALHHAAGDQEAYQKALHGIRHDPQLSEAARDAIYKTLAQQSLLWYIEAVTGKPMPLEEIEAHMAPPSTKK